MLLRVYWAPSTGVAHTAPHALRGGGADISALFFVLPNSTSCGCLPGICARQLVCLDCAGRAEASGCRDGVPGLTTVPRWLAPPPVPCGWSHIVL